MDEKPEIKTVRVRISVDENAPPRTKAGEMMHDLVSFAKKMVPGPDKSEENKEKKQ